VGRKTQLTPTIQKNSHVELPYCPTLQLTECKTVVVIIIVSTDLYHTYDKTCNNNERHFSTYVSEDANFASVFSSDSSVANSFLDTCSKEKIYSVKKNENANCTGCSKSVFSAIAWNFKVPIAYIFSHPMHT